MARRNRDRPADSFPYESLNITDVPAELVKEAYAWKWWSATDPKRPKLRAFRFVDADLDANGEKHLVQCGKLMELRLRYPKSSGTEYASTTLTIPPELANWCYLKFDRRDAEQRLYTVLPEAAKRYIAQTYYAACPFPDAPLRKIASWAGGRQAAGWYANVTVRPLGIASAVIYDGDKKSDGHSNYIHRFGEENGIRPVVCVDATGRIWFAGGDYTCPTPGITN